MSTEPDDEAQFEGIWYHWSCVQCGDVQKDENDIRGCEVECDQCQAKQRVSS